MGAPKIEMVKCKTVFKINEITEVDDEIITTFNKVKLQEVELSAKEFHKLMKIVTTENAKDIIDAILESYIEKK